MPQLKTAQQGTTTPNELPIPLYTHTLMQYEASKPMRSTQPRTKPIWRKMKGAKGHAQYRRCARNACGTGSTAQQGACQARLVHETFSVYKLR